MRVKDIMTHGVIRVAPETSVADALGLMARSHLSGLPVIDDAGALVGIVSQADLMRRGEIAPGALEDDWLECLLRQGDAARAFVRAHGRAVATIMTRDVVTIDQNAGLKAAVDLMETRGVNRLPTMQDGVVIGMITRGDFIRALARRLMRSSETEFASDEKIGRDVESELRRRRWTRAGSIDVRVKDGVVVLGGRLRDQRMRDAIRSLAESVIGVRMVLDNMDTQSPFSTIMNRIVSTARTGAR